METSLRQHFLNQIDEVIAYLPSLLAGLILLVIGVVLGWVAKRVVMQIAFLLRLDRFLIGFRWGKDFARADVRYGFYNFIGNVVFFIVVLAFLGSALSVWKLTALSNLLSDGILFFPRVAVALLIFGLGWLVAAGASRALHRGLLRERVPRARLLSRIAKSMLVIFFSAMALTELAVARQIVIIGFATVFVTLGAVIVVLAAAGGRDFFKSATDSTEEKEPDSKPE